MPLPIGFFAPLPLPVMIPFMAMQSFAMMYAAGTGWQYGKRKISSMTNEQFNPLTPVELNSMVLGSIHEMIPSFQQSSLDMREMNKVIFEEMRKMISDATSFFGELVFGMFSGIAKDATDALGGLNLGEQMPSSGIELISDSGQTNIWSPDTPGQTTQEKLKLQQEDDFFRQNMAHASDQTVLQAFDKLHGFRNTQKSIITAEYNKRGLNPKNQKETVPRFPDLPKIVVKEWSTPEALKWIADRDRNLIIHTDAVARRKSGTMNGAEQKRNSDIERNSLKILRTLSNDIRNPNNFIRQSALALRKILAQL